MEDKHMTINISNLVSEDNPILREKMPDVDMPLSDEDLETLRAMSIFVMESQTKKTDDEGKEFTPAVGLAAPQIGIKKRMFVIATTDDNNEVYTFGIVNPEITSYSKEAIFLKEGESCLSVKSVQNGKVYRPSWVRYTGYMVDLKTGEYVKKVMSKVDGYLNIVFQHEYDHLDGILFTDRIMPEEENNKESK
jgi:peptide deformylase